MTPRNLIAPLLVVAFAAGCGSDSSTTLQADTTPPAAPADVELRALGSHHPDLQIDWADNAESDLAGYVVERSLDEGETWTTITSVLTESTYTDTYQSRAQYRVTAVDTSENSSAYSTRVAYLATTGTPKFAADREGIRF
ncbi:MAG: fibronectin type III domain-containing protein [Gemmatimonadetes bacterium]|nr:fibronectin type III domain-containing protein [Gemmatimonadota bacterium]